MINLLNLAQSAQSAPSAQLACKPQPIRLPPCTDLPFLFEVEGNAPSVNNDTAGVIILYFLQPVKVKFDDKELSFTTPHVLIMPVETPHATHAAEDRNSTIIRAQTSLFELKAKLLVLKEKGRSVHIHDTQWLAHVAMDYEAARTSCNFSKCPGLPEPKRA